MSENKTIHPPLPLPDPLRRRHERLENQRDMLLKSRAKELMEREKIQRQLDLVEPVKAALEVLSNELFTKVIDLVQRNLTHALQEVLEQPIQLQAKSTFQNNGSSVKFSILRDGEEEDVYRGQGGSVANVLSVGLRMFAISTLDPSVHRRFLILDEQDCWLHPQLVPRLVRIVKQAGDALGFQVLMISHHDVTQFQKYADRVYTLSPDSENGVRVSLQNPAPMPAQSFDLTEWEEADE
jgi:hypothetical protein